MKNIKFKVLIMFMLLVLVGLGSSSVFATTQKVEREYLKIDDLYELISNRTGKWLKFYKFDNNDNNKVEKWPDGQAANGSILRGFQIADVDGYNDFGELWKVFVIDNIIEKDGVKWIRKEDWVEYLNTSTFMAGNVRPSMLSYADSVTHTRSDLETITVAPEAPPTDYEEDINNFWKKAFEWFKGAKDSEGMASISKTFMTGAKNIIKMIGNMIFIIVTSILGVKYIWGSADAKYSVKNSLFSLVIAAVVFYGWDSISNLIQSVTTSTVGSSIEGTTRTIYTYILYFVNIAAIGGIIFLGVKYLLASAEGKSQLKMNMGPAFLGIIMVYATISFLNTILNIFLG